MASIRRELVVEVSADVAWAAVRDVGAAHRLFKGVLVDARLDGDARVVTFANGMDASIQVVSEDARRSRLIWISDFLPNELKENIAQLMDAGFAAAKASLESVD
jgi:hypothetical protein